MDISVIIPFCNEVPHVLFTMQAIREELDGFCKYEIIVIDNMSASDIMCKSDGREWPVRQRRFFHNAKTGKTIGTHFFRKGIIKYLIYDKKLGHWNAKNAGIAASSGKFLFFLDSHCIMRRDSVRKMLEFLRHPPEEKIGGVHAYINYILDSHRLEYKVQAKFFGYQFCSAQPGKKEPYKVCVMSTCGMMSPRSAFDELGAWNPEFGIYGGGESYINWKQSTCGYPHYIHPEAECWHYADKRGYSWNYTDYMRNSFIAAYCVGGDKWLDQQRDFRITKKKGNPQVVSDVAEDVRTKCADDRAFIKSKQVVTFDEYIEWWEKHPGKWK